MSADRTTGEFVDTSVLICSYDRWSHHGQSYAGVAVRNPFRR